jgi:hypothetical protein
VLVASSCNSGTDPDPLVEDRCPLEPLNEFPPTDCAIVRGIARDSEGRPLPGLTLGVDSFVPTVGYAYSSSGEGRFVIRGSSDGSFEMGVARVNRLVPRTTPDTASVEIKVYGHQNVRAGDTAVTATPVRMWFAPLGQLVTPTVGDVVFVLPP